MEKTSNSACDLGGLLQRAGCVGPAGREAVPSHLGREPASVPVGVVAQQAYLDLVRPLVQGTVPYGQAVIGGSIVTDMHHGQILRLNAAHGLENEPLLDTSLLSKA